MTKNTIWQCYIAKYMKSIGIAFDVLETGKIDPVRCNRHSGYVTFELKMDFTRKAR